MKIVEGAGAHFITKSPCFVAFGAFDGIHKGHQALFEQLQHEAKLHGAQSCVFTFSNHPLEVIKPDTANYRLTVKEQKISLLRKMGLDIAVIVEFTKDFAEMSAIHKMTLSPRRLL